MPRLRRLSISLKPEHALSATRVSIGNNALVYVLIANKRLRYGKDKSRIAYIGTTSTGVGSMSQSVATRADAILRLHGVTSFHARVITCNPRGAIKTWKKLESGLLIAFRERFGTVPRFNQAGKRMQRGDVPDYFQWTRLKNIIDELS